MSGGEVNTQVVFSLHAIICRLENYIIPPQSALYHTASPLFVVAGTFSGDSSIVVIDPGTI